MSRRPEIVDNGDGTTRVDLGSIVSTLIVVGVLSGLTALGTVSVLAYRATAEEAKVEEIDEDVQRQGRNQMRMDEQQRRLGQDSQHALAKLDALLEAMKVTKRIPRPALPPSSLERKPESEDGG